MDASPSPRIIGSATPISSSGSKGIDVAIGVFYVIILSGLIAILYNVMNMMGFRHGSVLSAYKIGYAVGIIAWIGYSFWKQRFYLLVGVLLLIALVSLVLMACPFLFEVF